MDYMVTAQWGKRFQGQYFTAGDSFDATMKAIEIVMDKAMKTKTWEKGRIELRDADGVLLHVMPAK